MMSTLRRYRLLFLFGILLPLTAGAQESDKKVHAAGIGFSFSSGQSLFYTRSTNPFNTNHTYLAAGFHIEEEGIGVTIYDPWYGSVKLSGSQAYYLESGLGWRRLWFRESMAGGFLPHTSIEGGASGYIARIGPWRDYFRGTTLHWAPYVQAGLGASIHTGTSIYRVEMGYFYTLPLLPEDVFPPYGGAYLKMVISSGQKPR